MWLKLSNELNITYASNIVKGFLWECWLKSQNFYKQNKFIFDRQHITYKLVNKIVPLSGSWDRLYICTIIYTQTKDYLTLPDQITECDPINYIDRKCLFIQVSETKEEDFEG